MVFVTEPKVHLGCAPLHARLWTPASGRSAVRYMGDSPLDGAFDGSGLAPAIGCCGTFVLPPAESGEAAVLMTTEDSPITGTVRAKARE